MDAADYRIPKLTSLEFAKITMLDDVLGSAIEAGKGYRLKHGGFRLFVPVDIEVER